MGRLTSAGTGLAKGAVVIGGAIILISIANKKFDILGKFVNGLSNIGSAVGTGIGAGVANIPIGLAQGATSSFEASAGQFPKALQDFGNFITGKTAANPNPNNPSNVSPNATNPPGNNLLPQAFGSLPIIASGSQDKASFATNNRANIITTQKPSSFLPGINQTTYPRDVRTTTLVRGQPINSYLQNMIASGAAVQSIVINTSAGGTREVAGSPGLIARLQQNLRSASR